MIHKRLIPFYAIVIVVFLLLKHIYTLIDTEQVKFLLFPVNQFLQILTGVSSMNLTNEGYYFEKISIVLNKSCCGFNLLLICFLMLSFLFLKYSKMVKQQILVIPASLIIAYLLTIVINTCRIYVSIILQQPFSSALDIHSNMIHEVIGIINNVFFLTLTYYMTEKLLQKKFNHAELT